MQFTCSRAAEAEGIVMIHQEFNLAEDLSIAQIKTLMDGSNPLIQAMCPIRQSSCMTQSD